MGPRLHTIWKKRWSSLSREIPLWRMSVRSMPSSRIVPMERCCRVFLFGKGDPLFLATLQRLMALQPVVNSTMHVR